MTAAQCVVLIAAAAWDYLQVRAALCVSTFVKARAGWPLKTHR